MAKYVLSDEFTAISETSGTIVNISNVNAEISETDERGTGIILFPRHHFGFDKQVYAARARGEIGTAVIAAIATGGGSGGVSESQIATPEEIDEMLGDVFTTTPTPSSTSPATDTSGIATSEEIDEMLGEVFG